MPCSGLSARATEEGSSGTWSRNDDLAARTPAFRLPVDPGRGAGKVKDGRHAGSLDEKSHRMHALMRWSSSIWLDDATRDTARHQGSGRESFSFFCEMEMLNSMAHLMKWAPWQLEQINMASEMGGVGGGMKLSSSPDDSMLSREQHKQGRGDLAQERNSSAQGEQSVADPALGHARTFTSRGLQRRTRRSEVTGVPSVEHRNQKHKLRRTWTGESQVFSCRCDLSGGGWTRGSHW